MDRTACDVLRGIGRNVCTNIECGSLQAYWNRYCTRCGFRAPARPIREGDVIQEPLARPCAPQPPVEQQLQEPVALPADFVTRVRALPCNTMVHIPLCQRERMCTIMVSTMQGLVGGDPIAAALEEARSKLLLLPPPTGLNVKAEVATRIKLWQGGSFGELLHRVEEQMRTRAAAMRRRRGVNEASRRAHRARVLAREGAFSKAVSSLQTEMAPLDAASQHMWAAELLPTSSRPGRALAAPVADGAHAAGEPPLWTSALSGVRFGAMSAPGPSGMRPEHLREITSIRKRPLVNKLLRALSEFAEMARQGTLPPTARWILHSRLVYLRKKSGPAPRPIRVGEFWRRFAAKRLVHMFSDRLQQLFLRARQYGVCIPGGADVLVHFRTQLERTMRTYGQEALAMIDVDLKNAFGSLEWDSIRDSIARHAPFLSGWTAWCHQASAPVYLPCGDVRLIDRGAEQGDPLGSVYCAVVLMDVAERVRQRTRLPLLDVWFMDDGQMLSRPSDADDLLRALDVELARVGARRGTGEDAKSVARLIGTAAACDEHGHQWVTEHIRNTCRVPGLPGSRLSGESPDQAHVLGIDFGPEAAATNQFRATTEAVRKVHAAISLLDDAPSELVLMRRCADVCKVTHLLRACGPQVAEDALGEYDAVLRATLERTLGGDIPDAAALQATAAVSDGGLGMRRATDVAAPALIASCVQTRPFVRHLFGQLAGFGLDPARFLIEFDATAAMAINGLRASIGATSATHADQLGSLGGGSIPHGSAHGQAAGECGGAVCHG